MEQRTDQYSQIIFAESHEIKMEFFKRCIMEEFHLLLQLSMSKLKIDTIKTLPPSNCKVDKIDFE